MYNELICTSNLLLIIFGAIPLSKIIKWSCILSFGVISVVLSVMDWKMNDASIIPSVLSVVNAGLIILVYFIPKNFINYTILSVSGCIVGYTGIILVRKYTKEDANLLLQEDANLLPQDEMSPLKKDLLHRYDIIQKKMKYCNKTNLDDQCIKNSKEFLELCDDVKNLYDPETASQLTAFLNDPNIILNDKLNMCQNSINSQLVGKKK